MNETDFNALRGPGRTASERGGGAFAGASGQGARQ